MRAAEGLKKLGLNVPSPEAVRVFIKAFHQEEALEGRLPHQAFIPEEAQWPQGLGGIQKELVGKATRKDPSWKATIDLDATVIETHKREAYYTYLGERGYQSVVAHWAEQDLIVTDQFRDGNVPAEMDLLSVLKEAIGTLPKKGHETGSLSVHHEKKNLASLLGGLSALKPSDIICSALPKESLNMDEGSF